MSSIVLIVILIRYAIVIVIGIIHIGDAISVTVVLGAEPALDALERSVEIGRDRLGIAGHKLLRRVGAHSPSTHRGDVGHGGIVGALARKSVAYGRSGTRVSTAGAHDPTDPRRRTSSSTRLPGNGDGEDDRL